jgi:ABC-type hemin transport system ATPase subunit
MPCARDRVFLLRGGACIAEGTAREVLIHETLEQLYGAPVERLIDPERGTVAFLPG